MIGITATSAGMLDWHAEFDLGLQKKNTPPIIEIDVDQIDGTYATWSSDQYSFTLSGIALDPDGGTVTLSAEMCGDTPQNFPKPMRNGLSVYRLQNVYSKELHNMM